jgi:hypothetical protein
MEVLQAKTYQFNGRPALKILVDRFPELTYREIRTAEGETFFYAESGGLVSCYEYLPDSSEGYGGREIRLAMADGSERTFKGQLWNSWKRHARPEIPAHVEVSATDDAEVWERGYTFYAEAITKELAERLFAEAKAAA